MDYPINPLKKTRMPQQKVQYGMRVCLWAL